MEFKTAEEKLLADYAAMEAENEQLRETVKALRAGTSDSWQRIREDATLDPRVYVDRYECSHGIYDELADYVPDMCLHIIDRCAKLAWQR